jgi:hypothetical protein
MEKTAGAILAELLLTKEKGATKEEIEKKRQELAEQTKKQLDSPSTKVSVSINKD